MRKVLFCLAAIVVLSVAVWADGGNNCYYCGKIGNCCVPQ